MRRTARASAGTTPASSRRTASTWSGSGSSGRASSPSPGSTTTPTSTGSSAPTGCSTSRGSRCCSTSTRTCTTSASRERGRRTGRSSARPRREKPSPQPGFPINYVAQNAVNHAYDAFWANTQVPGHGPGSPGLLRRGMGSRRQALPRQARGRGLQPLQRALDGDPPSAVRARGRGDRSRCLRDPAVRGDDPDRLPPARHPRDPPSRQANHGLPGPDPDLRLRRRDRSGQGRQAGGLRLQRLLRADRSCDRRSAPLPEGSAVQLLGEPLVHSCSG